MSDTPHRATPEQWALIESLVEQCDYDSCLLELRARVEALETAIKSMGQAFDLASERLTARLETPATDKPVHDTLRRAIREPMAVATANAKPTSNPSQIRSSAPAGSLAAALRALADQPPGWRDYVRAELLSIAAELEGHK